MLLFIICGHGAGDPGACGNGYQEAELVRALAQRIAYFGGNEVMVGDTSKNWYKDKLVNNTNIPKGAKVLELHLDSGVATARGAHVIIDADFEPDKWDIALAEFISGILPGRSELIVKRNNLANPNRAQAAGINYRLLECGFISNPGDVEIFNSRMDEIAKGILNAFEINAQGVVTEPVAQTPVSKSKFKQEVYDWQNAAKLDGFAFPKYGCDGEWGAECESVASKAICKKRTDYRYKNLTRIVQRVCGTKVDGKFGTNTKNAVIAFQKRHGLTQDGCVGLNTWKKILGV